MTATGASHARAFSVNFCTYTNARSRPHAWFARSLKRVRVCVCVWLCLHGARKTGKKNNHKFNERRRRLIATNQRGRIRRTCLGRENRRFRSMLPPSYTQTHTYVMTVLGNVSVENTLFYGRRTPARRENWRQSLVLATSSLLIFTFITKLPSDLLEFSLLFHHFFWGNQGPKPRPNQGHDAGFVLRFIQIFPFSFLDQIYYF